MTDPLADVHAYYDAAARLNAGQPLYVQPAGIDDAAFYRYPPLLAILFRPLALLPFELAAAIWMTLIALMFVATLVRLDLRRPLTLFVVCALALPIGWSIVIGQAQVAVTLLLALGSPWAVAIAANLKVFPILVAVWWLGRRDWRPLGWLGDLGRRPDRRPAGPRAGGHPRLPVVPPPRPGRQRHLALAVRHLAAALGGDGRRARRARDLGRADAATAGRWR